MPLPGSGVGGMIVRPGLLERLAASTRVTMVSASAGSGKTVLLKSWIGEAGLGDRAAWVAAEPDERDPRRFWLSVASALRGTAPGSALVRPLTAAPDLDGWTIVERLLKDLAPLAESTWLVIDDVHELGTEALRQLELLILRVPSELRFVLAARHDVRLGLHRLRLEGELGEIREPDLRFSVAEARELFRAARVELAEPTLELLVERTEGWAAGLRLAALSLAGHPDPAGFAGAFSGTERTVAQYLLAEVLDRQPEPVRRLLLRTSILERVNGELADLLTGDEGGEWVLRDLERANAFVVSVDQARSWFRYHQMFAGLLRLELRRTAPGEVTGLHRAASDWFAAHGYPVEAVRHAQAARDWELAARLLADHWPGLYLDGQAGTAHELLAAFPAQASAADAELAAVAAADELGRGSLAAAERYLHLAEQKTASVPAGRRESAQPLLGIARLLLAHQRGDLPAVVHEVQRVQALAENPNAGWPALSADLRALAFISLGTTEFWATRVEEAERHLEAGIALARQIGRPFLELSGLAHQAAAAFTRSFAVVTERGMEAVELARRNGWTDEPVVSTACNALGSVRVSQGRLAEAETWVQRAELTLRAEAQPAAALAIRYVRGLLDLAQRRDADALTAFQSVEELAGRLSAPHHLVPRARAWQLVALVRLGQIQRAEQELSSFSDADRERGETRSAEAILRLATGDPHGAVAALAPVLDGSAPLRWRTWLAQAFLLEAIARDALGEPGAAEYALEQALDQAEPDGALVCFLLHPAPGLLQRHAHGRTAHAALIADVQSLLGARGDDASPRPEPLSEPLRASELRVLRYLPTNLTAPEIAAELNVSLHTVKTHMRNLYAKLGTHRRAAAVTRARDLGLLAPSALPR